MPTLLWFRRDLRLSDLPSLVEAGASGIRSSPALFWIRAF